MRWAGWLAVVVMGLGGCGVSFPRPMTAAEVASFDSGDALVVYLAQRDASPAVCDLRSTGPHVTRFDRDLATALVGGLDDGKVDLSLGQACINLALEGGSQAVAAQLIDAVGRDYHSLANDRALETSPALQARLAIFQAIYFERPSGKDGDPKTMDGIFDDLRRKFFRGQFGPVGARYVNELLGVVDLERGRYGGRPVDLATVDALAARGEENLLRRFADRLPAPDLRVEAQRQLIRLRIVASPFPEVRAQAAAVEARVMQQGVNRVSLTAQPAVRAWLDGRNLPPRNVLVRQDLAQQSATLFGHPTGGELSVVPNLALGGTLWVRVAGLSRPITICGASRSYDPTPCLGGDDVTIDNPLAASDHDGTFRFRDKVSEAEVVGLGRRGDSFPLAIVVGGRRLVAFSWPIRFERPNDLVLSSGVARGPTLQVTVTHTDPVLYLFTASGDGFFHRAVIEKSDLATFHLVSRGATGTAGMDGSSGMDGFAGVDGSSATCPSSPGGDGTRGGDGAAGGDGGPGGNGADGGDVFVQLQCGAVACSADDVALLRRAVLSQGGLGGRGGAGGPGGRGGRGGSGGSGTSCFDPSTNSSSSVSGGSSGMSGSDGASGSPGPDGSPGRPGVVRIAVVAAPHP
jgi:hypothetical protein